MPIVPFRHSLGSVSVVVVCVSVPTIIRSHTIETRVVSCPLNRHTHKRVSAVPVDSFLSFPPLPPSFPINQGPTDPCRHPNKESQLRQIITLMRAERQKFMKKATAASGQTRWQSGKGRKDKMSAEPARKGRPTNDGIESHDKPRNKHARTHTSTNTNKQEHAIRHAITHTGTDERIHKQTQTHGYIRNNQFAKHFVCTDDGSRKTCIIIIIIITTGSSSRSRNGRNGT